MEFIFSLLTAFGIISANSGTTVYLPTIYPSPSVASTQIIYSTPTPTPTAMPVTEQMAVVVIVDTPTAYNPWQDVPTISYMETATTTEAPQVETSPTPDYMQYIGTPVPGALTPKSPMIVINLDDLNDLDIDTAWDMIATPGRIPGHVLPACPNPLPTPFVDQSMAVEASLLDTAESETIEIPASEIARIMARGGGYFPYCGYVIRPENGLLSELMSYGMFTCQDQNGIVVYGTGV